MRKVNLLSLILCIVVFTTSCSKNGNTSATSVAPAMNAHYWLPAYVTDGTAPNARNNVALTTSMPDAIYYTTNVPAAGVVFTFKDQTGAVLTTQTGVPQVIAPSSQYTVVNLPSSFIVPTSWVGKVVTITASNSAAFTMYRII